MVKKSVDDTGSIGIAVTSKDSTYETQQMGTKWLSYPQSKHDVKMSSQCFSCHTDTTCYSVFITDIFIFIISVKDCQGQITSVQIHFVYPSRILFDLKIDLLSHSRSFLPLCLRICETGTWRVTNWLLLIIIILWYEHSPGRQFMLGTKWQNLGVLNVSQMCKLKTVSPFLISQVAIYSGNQCINIALCPQFIM